jgi:hypothetical protein
MNMTNEEIKVLMQGLKKWKAELTDYDPKFREKNKAFNVIYSDFESQEQTTAGAALPSDLTIHIPPPSNYRDMSVA